MEDEIHALFECPLYETIRATELGPDMMNLDQETLTDCIRKAIQEGSDELMRFSNFFRKMLKVSFEYYSQNQTM